MHTYFHICWGIYLQGGLPRWVSGKESACNAGDRGSIPNGKIPWRRKWQSLQCSFFFFYPPVFLPGKSDGQRSLLGYKAIGSQQQYLQGKFLEVGLLGQKVKTNSFVSKD